jgi:hypothetical protein
MNEGTTPTAFVFSMLSTFYFLSLMLTAIAMSLALAHPFELPNKIDISANQYLIVQRNY